MASVVMVVSILALSQSTISSMRLAETNRESALAVAFLRQAVEDLQAQDFDDIYALYNTDPADDPDGAGTAPGANFAVEGLSAQDGDADGMVGEIEFPTLTDAFGDLQLREDVVDADLGMPADLNGDGVVDDLNHAADYELLPVRVRLSWTGTNGPRTIEIATLVGDR